MRIYQTLKAAILAASVSALVLSSTGSSISQELGIDEAASETASELPAWPQEAADTSQHTSDGPLTAEQSRAARAGTMPTLKPGEYGTDRDNQNNRGTNTPDYDMDTYLYNTSTKSPIEFDVILPSGSTGRSGTLRLDVYDVDVAQGEVDIVYVNNVRVGTLNGRDSTWGVNIFTIAPGILRAGRNTVKVDIDTKNPKRGNWAVTINWGIIALAGGSANVAGINRCWVTPTTIKAGQPVNFFAELAETVSQVKVIVAGRTIYLTDPDGDKVWSTAWVPPVALKGRTYAFSMQAIKSGRLISTCPTLKITP